MPIGDLTLEAWATAPDDKPVQRAYEQIKKAISASTALQSRRIDVYLQGSYRNRTHIKENSDVDVVIELQSTFSPDISYLAPQEKQLFNNTFPSSSYSFWDLRKDAEDALIGYFGAKAVSFGNKSIKIAGTQERSNADVVPCLEHRKYIRFRGADEPYIRGIKFYTRLENSEIVNWPKVHFDNGAAKNSRTGSMYKSLVRICKNLRDFLIAEGHLGVEVAPSYFLECLLYNMPDNRYEPSYGKSLKAAASFLKQANLNEFCCVNEQDHLFDPPKGWDINKARDFINWMDMLMR